MNMRRVGLRWLSTAAVFLGLSGHALAQSSAGGAWTDGFSLDLREGDRLVVGIASATQSDLAAQVRDHYPVFGGSRTPGDWPGDTAPRHACPGYSMGMGVLLGLISALLDAGTLRATASPNTLVLSA